MKVIRSLDNLERLSGYPMVTMGNFDGLHKGHILILNALQEKKACTKDACSLFITFDPHPWTVLPEKKHPGMLLEFDKKLEILGNIGMDYVVCMDFTDEFSKVEPDSFVKDILVDIIGTRDIFVGRRFRFGRGGKGSIDDLNRLGAGFGFGVWPINELVINGDVVSSSRIRRLILRGLVEQVPDLMGRCYSISGKVIKGVGRGRKIGFPTANLAIPRTILPHNGIYAVLVKIKNTGQSHKAVTYIGTQPTFGSNARVVEVHIPEVTLDLYGQDVEVIFLKKIREDMAFDSTDALVRQIKADIKQAQSITCNDVQ